MRTRRAGERSNRGVPIYRDDELVSGYEIWVRGSEQSLRDHREAAIGCFSTLIGVGNAGLNDKSGAMRTRRAGERSNRGVPIYRDDELVSGYEIWVRGSEQSLRDHREAAIGCFSTLIGVGNAGLNDKSGAM
ncbi:MAG TPA: hypothetical protein PLT59_00330 [Bacteroidales bacterium]|nr:hypothetical protein [Bacteroidales bacterium]